LEHIRFVEWTKYLSDPVSPSGDSVDVTTRADRAAFGGKGGLS